MWDLIVSVPDHCLSFYFTTNVDLVAYFFKFAGVPYCPTKRPSQQRLVRTDRISYIGPPP